MALGLAGLAVSAAGAESSTARSNEVTQANARVVRPFSLGAQARTTQQQTTKRSRFVCRDCGALARGHVALFDERPSRQTDRQRSTHRVSVSQLVNRCSCKIAEECVHLASITVTAQLETQRAGSSAALSVCLSVSALIHSPLDSARQQDHTPTAPRHSLHSAAQRSVSAPTPSRWLDQCSCGSNATRVRLRAARGPLVTAWWSSRRTRRTTMPSMHCSHLPYPAGPLWRG